MGTIHERWQATPTWDIAVALHAALCRSGHGMDRCWGLVLPYDLAQQNLSTIQAHYLTLAYTLEAELGAEQALRLAKFLSHQEALAPLPDLLAVDG